MRVGHASLKHTFKYECRDCESVPPTVTLPIKITWIDSSLWDDFMHTHAPGLKLGKQVRDGSSGVFRHCFVISYGVMIFDTHLISADYQMDLCSLASFSSAKNWKSSHSDLQKEPNDVKSCHELGRSRDSATVAI